MDNAGKTSLLEALTGGYPGGTSPTLGYGIKQLLYNGIEFNIFDLGGQNSLRDKWKNYYDKVSGIIWVIDSTDRRRIFEARIELQVMLKEPKLRGLPLLIMANKQDLVSAMKPDQIAEKLSLNVIRDRKYKIQSCSALLKIGIDEGMNFMTCELTPSTMEQIFSRKSLEDSKAKSIEEKKVKQTEKQEKKKFVKDNIHDKNRDDLDNSKNKKNDETEEENGNNSKDSEYDNRDDENSKYKKKRDKLRYDDGSDDDDNDTNKDKENIESSNAFIEEEESYSN